MLLSVGCLFKKKKFLVHMHMLRLLSFEYKGIIVKLAWVKEGRFRGQGIAEQYSRDGQH